MIKKIQNLKIKIKKLISHRHFIKYEKYVSLILWLGIIFYLSSKPLTFLVATDIWELIIRKLAHMFEFAVLAYLFFRILSQTEKRHVNWNLFWAFFFSILYAISDEYHQTFVFGRSGTFSDVLIDLMGIVISLWLVQMHYYHQKRQKEKI